MLPKVRISPFSTPADDVEIRRAVAASGKAPAFSVLTPGQPRAAPSQKDAAALGLKIGTYPTGMLSPAIAGIQAGLDAIGSGAAEAPGALPGKKLREVLGYDDYDAHAKQFIS